MSVLKLSDAEKTVMLGVTQLQVSCSYVEMVLLSLIKMAFYHLLQALQCPLTQQSPQGAVPYVPLISIDTKKINHNLIILFLCWALYC